VACTDTSIQMIVQLAKDKKVSLNDVRRRSGAPHGTPMNAYEALRALHSYGLPYEIKNDIAAMGSMRSAREKGPVIICELYGAQPQWQDYVYMGRKLDGTARNYSGNKVRPGFSHPLRRSGLTQWTFRDGHAVLLATSEWGDGQWKGIVRDPNHNSASRPERPAYDVVSKRQLDRMISSYASKYGFKVALVPTKTVIKR